MAYTQGERLGLDVWCEDEAGPFQTRPQPGQKWCPVGHPERFDHTFIRQGTAKLLTLFHPRDGVVKVKGVVATPNTTIHPWLEDTLGKIIEALPQRKRQRSAAGERALWEVWQKGMCEQFTLPQKPVPLRLLLVLDNLTGHKSYNLISWFYNHGVMPLFTPLGGSWLNMAESIQRIIKRRGLDGSCPAKPADIIDWLEAAAEGWNKDPTPFIWGGKRAARRHRAKERHHKVGGSGAYALRPIKRAVG